MKLKKSRKEAVLLINFVGWDTDPSAVRRNFLGWISPLLLVISHIKKEKLRFSFPSAASDRAFCAKPEVGSVSVFTHPPSMAVRYRNRFVPAIYPHKNSTPPLFPHVYRAVENRTQTFFLFRLPSFSVRESEGYRGQGFLKGKKVVPTAHWARFYAGL